MANDFSTDTNCVALYRFESGSLTTDSKGSNTLTDYNTVSEATGAGNFQEGSCSADFEYNNNEAFYRADADLSSGFPFKNGDTTKIASVCLWFKVESFNYNCTLVGKLDQVDKRSFVIQLTDPTAKKLQLGVGYSSGGVTQLIDLFSGLSTGIWYHVGVVVNSSGSTVSGLVDKGYIARLWNGSSASTVSSTFTNDAINVEDGAFSIGGRMSSGSISSSYAHDGLIDEVVIFKDILSESEIDQIRQGAYGSSGSTVPKNRVLNGPFFGPFKGAF